MDLEMWTTWEGLGEKENFKSSWTEKKTAYVWGRRGKNGKQPGELFIQKDNWSNVLQLLWGQNKYSWKSLWLKVSVQEIYKRNFLKYR